MKNKMPLDGLGLGHDSGSVHCDMLKMLCFRTAWGGKLREVREVREKLRDKCPRSYGKRLLSLHFPNDRRE